MIHWIFGKDGEHIVVVCRKNGIPAQASRAIGICDRRARIDAAHGPGDALARQASPLGRQRGPKLCRIGILAGCTCDHKSGGFIGQYLKRTTRVKAKISRAVVSANTNGVRTRLAEGGDLGTCIFEAFVKYAITGGHGPPDTIGIYAVLRGTRWRGIR